jgi:hypothetical protein
MNPKVVPSAVARAQQRPVVGRSAHQLPELEEMVGESGVTFFICYFLFFLF